MLQGSLADLADAGRLGLLTDAGERLRRAIRHRTARLEDR
jgi:hypothetical protein